MANPKYVGTQAFIRQAGDTVQFNDDGTATHTVTWRGAKHRLNAFRGSVPTTSPDFPTLRLARPPSEVREGAYVRVTATYGGTSNEITANYPNDVDDDDQDIPTTQLLADFQQTSVVLEITTEPNAEAVSPLGSAQFEVSYRQPINTIIWTSGSKPARVSKRSRSGIEGEAAPKLLQATQITPWSELGVFTPSPQGLTPLGLVIKHGPTNAEPQWEVRTVAVGFSRESVGKHWRVSETWTKGVFQVNEVEDD